MKFTGRERCWIGVLLMVIGIEARGQQLYDNQENVMKVKYLTRPKNRVSSFASNPKTDSVNASGRCLKFSRNRQRYDYIKVIPDGKLEDVSVYASTDPEAPKMKMKVFTNAPAGSLVELQLGKQEGVAYPDGTHSQYQAVTTRSNEWEELEFRFVQIPEGSRTGARDVDQVTLLFLPNSHSIYTFYFDDLTGPPIREGSALKSQKRKRN